VIIVNPNPVIRLNEFHRLLTKSFVNLNVSFPKCFLVDHIGRKVTKKRPDDPVGKTIIVLFNLTFRKKNGMTVFGHQLCFYLAFGSFYGFPGNTGPPYPQTLAGFVKGLQTGRQTSNTPIKTELIPSPGYTNG
jgi:hypothetical protein